MSLTAERRSPRLSAVSKPRADGNGSIIVGQTRPTEGRWTAVSQLGERLKQQIEAWANELIDLSRRNTSLYYRKTKRSTLEIVQPSPSALVEYLNSGSSLEFFEPPDTDDWTVEASIENAGPRELVTRKTRATDLNATLRNIARAAELDFNDRGLQTLSLGVGMLRWRAVPEADWDTSPLLYIPVTIDRASTRSPRKRRRYWPGRV